jgi:hypothetical protein
MPASQPSRLKRTVWHVILFVPVFTAICVPLFNRMEPSIAGVPFFYWFQLVLIVVAAVVTALAYRAKI